MGKLSSRTSGSGKELGTLTFRVRGIPHGLDVEGAKNLLRASLEVGGLSIDSLAKSSDRNKEQVATFRLHGKSAKLVGDRTQWAVPAVGASAYGKQLLVDTHFEGFTPLHDPAGDNADALDCVAISGLGSHAFGSWKDRHSSHMWLRDALPQYLPNARVLIYGYDSKLAGSHSFQNLSDVGSRFRASLRVVLGTVSRDRPLIFLAHSLGGLVLKQAMVQMCSGDAADFRNFKATYGILFFGVPNQGMDISSLLAMVRGQPNLHFLSTLSRDGGFLQGLIEQFRTVFYFLDSRIYSFYETEMSPTAQEGENGEWTMNGRPAVLVDRHSAISGRSWEREHFHLPISCSHSEMVKFSEYSEDCGIVCDIMRRFGENARAVIRQRWWWWERDSTAKISFSGNPIFKMLFSDNSTAQSTGSGVQSNATKNADTESHNATWVSSASKSDLSSFETRPTIQRDGNPASDVGPGVVPQNWERPPGLYNAISDKSSRRESSERSQILFGSTVRGSGKYSEGYKRIGVLFLTWETEIQCGLADVDRLRDLMRIEFNFDTYEFKIPTTRWQTSFAKAISDFTYNYDNLESLAIVYYGGFGYSKKDTGVVELTGKVKEDVVVDGMLEDLRTCLQPLDCDILVLLDYCSHTDGFDAFKRKQPGRRGKAQMLAPGTAEVVDNAANTPGSFTGLLSETLRRLLKASPHGFPSSSLYFEIYRASPSTKPQYFYLSQGPHEMLWLNPHVPSLKPPRVETKDDVFLNLRLRLDDQRIDISMMNRIASHLQSLPHVKEIRFENLTGPREDIASFGRSVLQAAKLRPLMRRLYARRKLRELRESSKNSELQYPVQSWRWRLDNPNHDGLYDWSSARIEHPKEREHSVPPRTPLHTKRRRLSY